MSSSTLCPWRMQVHHIQQETPDVWTLALINHDFYRWQAGQFALVKIGNSDELRAYTLSSTPGQSPFITLTIRHIEQGKGSGWLTQHVRPGNDIWLSDPQGDFSCERHPASHYLFLAAGCGITPIMSMCRWLKAKQPDCNVQLLYSVRSPQDIIFADELRTMQPWLTLTIIAENRATDEMLSGRLDGQRLAALVPDINRRTVMICGPQPYMDGAQQSAQALGAEKILLEQFNPTDSAEASDGDVQFTIRSPKLLQGATFPSGWSLLAAMEQHQLPVATACRSGVCGCCKTRIAEGNYRTSSQQTLTESEINAGYVLACSCFPQSDIVLA
ncbi:NADH oxidoreductase [Erwinia sorbitola]|uniref:NADH oxidoreductase n=1 Tax=Erwinia sorbitola TaxID=2681984 RepID=A0ABW9R920_9GAMM|nr:NADH oxidoreductase [Erwinia sorbitola]MTD26638.1 NADH oxidoreductase [Erwinia sorbitola]